jgi:hypothetical protein
LGRQLPDPEAGHLGDPEDDEAASQRTGRRGV